MPNMHSLNHEDFWDGFMGDILFTEDKLVNDDLEMDFGSMSTQDLIDTIDLLKEDDMAIPVDLSVELNSRGLIFIS